MSTIALPTPFQPSVCTLRLAVNQRVNASPFGGSEQAVDLLNDRWLLSCDLPANQNSTGPAIEAFIGSLRGQSNVVALWHFARAQPRGTVRGTLTLNAAVAQGASQIVVAGCSPATGTLLAGDMLGVGNLLFMVATDCVAVAGVITVPIVNRVRAALSSGASVTWSKPTALFRLQSSSVVQYVPMVAQTVSFDFGEAL